VLLNRNFNYKRAKQLRLSYENDRQGFVREHLQLLESKDSGALNAMQLGEIYLATHGEAAFEAVCGPNYKTRVEDVRLLEATDVISTQAFAQISGQIVYNRTREAFELHPTEQIFRRMCETTTTNIIQGEKIAGIGSFGDVAQVVKEGDAYPEVGLSQEWVTTPQLLKSGFIASATREAMLSDRTGLLGQRISGGAEWLALNRFKRGVNMFVGATNSYNRNGVYTNTYLSSGPYVNAISPNPLIDYTSLETAHLQFFNNVDPNTNEPILMRPDCLWCPMELEVTAERIRGGDMIRVGDGSFGTVATYSPNPVKSDFKYKFDVVASPYFKIAMTAAGVPNPTARWFYGIPKKAFMWMQAWDIETVTAGASEYLGFERDIVSRYKVGLMGQFSCYEARYVQADN